MVTTRNLSNTLSNLQRTKFLDVMKMFGRTNILLTHATITKNQFGRPDSLTDSTTIIPWGDLQFVTLQDKPLLDAGYAKLGDGIFYTTNDISIVPEDQIVVDSIYWELSKQIEGETINGNLIYQAWTAKRRTEE